MGRGDRQARPGPVLAALWQGARETARSRAELYQLVRIDETEYAVRLEGDLLCTVEILRGNERHVLSQSFCTCGDRACEGRRAVEAARAAGFTPFVPLDPTAPPVDGRVIQVIPLGLTGERAVCRADAWGDQARIDVIDERGTRSHTFTSGGGCGCLDQPCAQLLELARGAGLRPFEPQGGAYRLMARTPRQLLFEAPYALAPRLGPERLYASTSAGGGWIVTELGLRTLSYRVTGAGCGCARATCLHRSLPGIS